MQPGIHGNMCVDGRDPEADVMNRGVPQHGGRTGCGVPRDDNELGHARSARGAFPQPSFTEGSARRQRVKSASTVDGISLRMPAS